MRVRTFVAIGGALIAAAQAGGQSVGSMVESDFLNAGKDIVSVWASPLHGTASDWLGAAGVVGLAAAVSPWDDNVDRWIVANRNAPEFSALKELREGGVAFSGTYITPAAIGVYGLGLITKSQGLRDGVMGCAAGYAAGSVVRNYVLYYLVARTRPDSFRNGNDTPPAQQGDQYHFRFPGVSDWGRHATPAGHVANVAACAGYLNTRFHTGWLAIPIDGVAVAVGFGRMVDRRHWTSDTVLGTLFGYAIGKDIGIRSDKRLGAGQNGRADALLLPSIGGSPDGHGVALTWNLTY